MHTDFFPSFVLWSVPIGAICGSFNFLSYRWGLARRERRRSERSCLAPSCSEFSIQRESPAFEWWARNAVRLLLWKIRRINNSLLQNSICRFKCTCMNRRLWISYVGGDLSQHPSAIRCLLFVIDTAKAFNQRLRQKIFQSIEASVQFLVVFCHGFHLVLFQLRTVRTGTPARGFRITGDSRNFRQRKWGCPAPPWSTSLGFISILEFRHLNSLIFIRVISLWHLT